MTALQKDGQGIKSGFFNTRDRPMDDISQLPTYADEYLASLSLFELTDLVIENEDRVPRNLIDECARRGDEMSAHLRHLHEIDYLWDPEGNTGLWWMGVHVPMILGLIPGDEAASLLVQLMRRISHDGASDLQDWLAGYWPALFKNKSEQPALRELSEDRRVDWYVRANAIEAYIGAAHHRGDEEFEAALAWCAGIACCEEEGWDVRLSAADTLLDYKRPEYRALLDELAGKRDGACVRFDRHDVERIYAQTDQKPDRFAHPWKFYEADQIASRQIRWREVDERMSGGPDDPFVPYYFPETYVRPEPKTGRNDPCPCGSGKKYKKCCLN